MKTARQFILAGSGALAVLSKCAWSQGAIKLTITLLKNRQVFGLHLNPKPVADQDSNHKAESSHTQA
jgi:hypothetical protein